MLEEAAGTDVGELFLDGSDIVQDQRGPRLFHGCGFEPHHQAEYRCKGHGHGLLVLGGFADFRCKIVSSIQETFLLGVAGV